MIRWICAGLALCLHVVAVARPQDTPVPPLLKRAMETANRVRYAGVRLVEFREGPGATSHIEFITRDRGRFRIEFPKDSPLTGQIIVEDARERRHFFPDRNEIHVLPPRREEAYERLMRMSKSRRPIRFAVAEGGAVAGRATRQVVVSDPSGNVIQKIYVDDGTGVVLKRELFDAVGAKFGGFEFREINFSPRIRKDLFSIERRGARIVTPTDMLEELAKREGFVPIVLPASRSTRLEWSVVRQIGGEKALMQMYAGSGGRLTLFQLRQPVDAEKLRGLTRGRANFVYWRRQDRTFVLVGARPPEELEAIVRPIASGTAIGRG